VQAKDGTRKTLRAECEASLKRLGTDHVELYYLHAPDPNIPIEESALAIQELMEEGKVRSAGVSNVSRAQLEAFHKVCPLAAFQPYYNMLQREIEASELPWCIAHNVSVMAYWPLMKGLLAGKLSRDHMFDPKDGRRKYPMFHGEEWEKNQDFLDELRPIASELGKPLSEVVINWTIQRPGITAALCGAKRPEQIRETAASMSWRLSSEHTARIDAAIKRRGPINSRGAV
jgi:aryl-alcohol dehydrogenase-like predicted oxidoreductase